MIGSGFKKLAGKYGLTVEHGVAYGMLKGCLVSLSEGAGYKSISICVGHDEHVPQAEGAQDECAQFPRANELADRILELAGDYERYRVMRENQRLHGVVISQGGSAVTVNFFDNPGTLKCIEAFIEEVMPQIAPLTSPNECVVCGRDTSGDACVMLAPGECVLAMDSECAARVEDAWQEKRGQRQGSVARGAIGAVLGALIGAAIWCAVGMFGYTAAIVGVIIAILAGKGYDMLGGKPGRARWVCVIICSLLAVVLGDAATIGITLYQEYMAAGAELQNAITLYQYFGFMWDMILTHSDVRGAILGDLALGWLFTLVGCIGVLRKSSDKASQNRVIRLRGGI